MRAIGVLFLSALSAAAMRLPARMGRRDAAAALVALPTLCLHPQRAAAGLFGGDDSAGPQGEFRRLQMAQAQINELVRKLSAKELQGDRPDDAIVVLQTLTIQFGAADELMNKATAAMPKLEASEQAKAREATARFTASVGAVKDGCREKSAETQLAGAKDASEAISQYFAVAAAKYPLPTMVDPLYYSKDPTEFASQYFGIFSCEGQGLERIPGSNSCRGSSKKTNVNPLPTKNLLDFDFLTGESVDKVNSKTK